MLPAPIPENEKERLSAVLVLKILDTPTEERFDRITKMAVRLFKAPISTITIVDANREWFKSYCGLSKREGPRAISFCGHAMLEDDIFIIPDAKKDPRFRDNPMVVGKPFIRFYAGMPLFDASGQRIGTLCIKDLRPRKMSKQDIQSLKDLAAWAELELNSHNLSLAIKGRKQAEIKLKAKTEEVKELAEGKSKEETVLLSIGEGLVVVDKKGKIVMVNKTFEDLTGWKQKEVLGKKYKEEVAPRKNETGKIVPFKKTVLARALAGGITTKTISHSPWYITRKDGMTFSAASTIAPVVFNKKIIGAVEVLRDITKEKELDRAKTEFVSLAAHQLRTPLAATKWIIELLQESDNFTAGQKEKVSDLYVSNERLISLVNDLLNVARIESGKKIVSKSPANLLSVVKDAISALRPEVDGKRQKINLSVNAAISKTQLDRLLLGEVVKNLLSNAIAYSPEQSVISIIIGLKDKNYLVSINNRGLLIPESERNKIFTKFYRGLEAKKIKPTGSGLGLFLVKSTVEAHGGLVWFESNRRHGTTFYFTIPKK